MKKHYDYTDLLSQFDEELSAATIKLDSEVQTLRSENPAFDDYRPVVDRYYDDDFMMEILNGYDFDDKKELSPDKKQYLLDKPNLTTVKFKDLIKELKDLNSIT